MLLYVTVLICFASTLGITSYVPSTIFPCSNNITLEEFRCENGDGCINIGQVCDGKGDCTDASDELACLPHNTRIKRQSMCTVPEHPPNGKYAVENLPGAQPGQSFASLVLSVKCRRGFGVPETSSNQVFCINGKWFGEDDGRKLPRCVRYCKLHRPSSTRFECRDKTGFIECGEYMAPGTSVRPVCNSPNYYSTENLPNMNCIHGSWDYVARCKAECGRITPEAWALLLDGRTAKRGELPWHVGIYRKTSSAYTQICGGSLVSNNAVISAAHCFWSDVKKLLPASDFAVATGKLYRHWDNERDFDAQKSNIKTIKIPRLFQGGQANFQEDIAVLILETPITYKINIRPVCLNFDSTFNRLQLQPGKLGKVAGWGIATDSGEAANILQVTDMPFIEENLCIDTQPASFREYITGDKFCAGYTNGTVLCRGDSGGGLAFPDRELGIDRFYLRGIVSAAPQSEDKPCNDKFYTTFTKISIHEEFIKETIEGSVKKMCPHYLFQCADGSCTDQGADCNGVKECADGSDESEELCRIGTNTTNMPSPTGKCALPSYPKYGTYVVANAPGAEPDQTYDSWLLTVSCDQGYSVVDARGNIAEKGNQVSCSYGKWDKGMPKCGRPSKPGKFLVWFRNETSLLVFWQPPSQAGAFTHYKLSILPPDAEESVLYVEKESDPPGPAQAAFKNLVPGRRYNISVQTILGSQVSAPINEVYRTTPLRPLNVTVPLDEVSESSFRVTWMPPLLKSEFDKYDVSVSGPEGRRPAVLLGLDEKPSTRFEGLTPGGSYTVSVKALSGKVRSWPAKADVTLKPLPVEDLTWRYGKEVQDKIIVWWAPATNSSQDQYKVVYHESGASRDSGNVVTTMATRLLLETKSPEKDYTVAVSAISRGVESRERVVVVPKRPPQAEVTTEPPASDMKPLRDNFELP